ncbi:MAG TPA: glycoside hydrolase family 3 C-terminal domain-containing protein, partial [Balneolaceae bacterium]|nr:glycoside hydrolase family 3 C-terminal domain-containing protein [Balneolaceae bacterium]
MGSANAYSQSLPQLGRDPLKDVVGAMTLKEKVQLVVGTGWGSGKLPGAAGQTFAIPRLGIPSMVLSDGPAGVRIKPIRDKDSSKTYYATAFPVARLLASTWDPSIVGNVGKAYGEEAHEYGVDVALTPALNIHRNPLNGRNFEYYSEDPLIAGEMAAAMVKGIQSQGVGTSIKHFVANNQESNRHNVNTIVSERALREIYLKGFEIAVKQSQPWTVMSSYNKVNGTYTSQRYDLLTTVLRDEWGFDGFVMTDWTGGDDPVAQMKAGNDLIEPGNKKKIKTIIDAVHSGKLEESVLDQNASRIMNIILKSPSFKKYNYSNNPDLQVHAKIARQAGAQGMVLLKNENALPLKKSDTIVAFGNASYDIIIGGTGSGEVNQAYKVQLDQGLTDAGYNVDQYFKKDYLQYLNEAKAEQSNSITEMPVSAAQAREEAENNDVAIITIGRNAGEGSDREQGDFYLNDNEKSLIKNVSQAFHAQDKKVVVVLNIAGIVDVARWRDQVDGILLAWQPGQEAGHAIADVLSGKVDPSGRLATTIPVKYSDVPSSEHFPGTPEKKPEQVIYKEGIYNGYRYYDTFDVQPAYEFGYGLSYTNFSFDDMKLSSTSFDGKLSVTTRIANNGEVAGKEVVQLYLNAPSNTLDKPTQELKGFAKTKLLEPGDSQTVTFELM